jgi:hypothetical protein
MGLKLLLLLTLFACVGSAVPRAAIEKLREQNNSLKEELLMENKFSVAPTNHNINAAINRCQDQLDLYTKKVCLSRSDHHKQNIITK